MLYYITICHVTNCTTVDCDSSGYGHVMFRRTGFPRPHNCYTCDSSMTLRRIKHRRFCIFIVRRLLCNWRLTTPYLGQRKLINLNSCSKNCSKLLFYWIFGSSYDDTNVSWSFVRTSISPKCSFAISLRAICFRCPNSYSGTFVFNIVVVNASDSTRSIKLVKEHVYRCIS